jgi:hypothetical protein
MSSEVPKSNSRAVVVAMYLIPLGLVMLFWTSLDVGGVVPMRYRLAAAMWQATGPLSFPVLQFAHKLDVALTIAPIVFAIAWPTWLVIVLATRLRQISYVVHLIASVVWCASGLPTTGLLIT